LFHAGITRKALQKILQGFQIRDAASNDMRNRLHAFPAQPPGKSNGILEVCSGNMRNIKACAQRNRVRKSLDPFRLRNRRFDRIVSDEILYGRFVHGILSYTFMISVSLALATSSSFLMKSSVSFWISSRPFFSSSSEIVLSLSIFFKWSLPSRRILRTAVR
jgi:hypothetical protein